jgi:hypothetical protein
MINEDDLTTAGLVGWYGLTASVNVLVLALKLTPLALLLCRCFTAFPRLSLELRFSSCKLRDLKVKKVIILRRKYQCAGGCLLRHSQDFEEDFFFKLQTSKINLKDFILVIQFSVNFKDLPQNYGSAPIPLSGNAYCAGIKMIKCPKLCVCVGREPRHQLADGCLLMAKETKLMKSQIFTI